MSTLSDLALEYYSTQLGDPPGLSISDAELAYYQSIVADPDGKSLDDLRYAFYIGVLSGEIVIGDGGGETPVEMVLGVPGPGVTIISGTPAGTITVRKFSDRLYYDLAITAAASWEVHVPYTTDIPGPKFQAFWEHDLPNSGAAFSNNAGSEVRFLSGGTVFNRTLTIGYLT